MSEFKIQDIESYEYRKRIAEMKFSIIGPVVAGTYTDRSINAYFQRVQNMEIELPDEHEKKIFLEDDEVVVLCLQSRGL